MYKVFNCDYKDSSIAVREEAIQIVNCDLESFDKLHFHGFYVNKKKVNVYFNSFNNINSAFFKKTFFTNEKPLSYEELFNLINSIVDRKIELIMDVNAKRRVVSNIYKALLFYDDYI